MGVREDTCRSCGAEVLFVTSGRNPSRTMILDREPMRRVIVTLGRDGPAYLGSGAEGKQGLTTSPPGSPAEAYVAWVGQTFQDHHGTCPAAQAWAGRSRKDPPA